MNYNYLATLSFSRIPLDNQFSYQNCVLMVLICVTSCKFTCHVNFKFPAYYFDHVKISNDVDVCEIYPFNAETKQLNKRLVAGKTSALLTDKKQNISGSYVNLTVDSLQHFLEKLHRRPKL